MIPINPKTIKPKYHEFPKSVLKSIFKTKMVNLPTKYGIIKIPIAVRIVAIF